MNQIVRDYEICLYNIRWLIANGRMTLQQLWHVYSVADGSREEWRDVPQVDDYQTEMTRR